MNKPTRNKHPLLKIANDAPVDLPTPSTIRDWWIFGSLLGICLVAQIVTGLFLAIHCCPNIDIAFYRVRHIGRDVNYGRLLRTLHANVKARQLLFHMDVSCHRPFLPSSSLEPAMIPTAQASSFTLQYFPYYVWCSKYSCLLKWIYPMSSWYSFQIFPYASRYYSSGSNYYWYNLRRLFGK